MFEYVSQYTKQAFPFYSQFVCGSRRISALMEIPPPSHTHTYTHWRKAEVCRMCIARKNLEAHTKYNQVRTRAEKCHTPVQAGLVMQGIDTSPAAYQTALANKSSPIRVCLPGLAQLGCHFHSLQSHLLWFSTLRLLWPRPWWHKDADTGLGPWPVPRLASRPRARARPSAVNSFSATPHVAH